MKVKYIIGLSIVAVILLVAILQPDKFEPLDKSVQIDKITVIKSARILELSCNNSLIKTYDIALGRVPVGHKEFEGDKRTPEGKYYITDKNPNSGYHKNLGISYPNQTDIVHAENLGKNPGGLIKIHGIKNGLGWIGRYHLLFDWTMGCIAVTDKEIDELYDIVEIGTPIEIKP